MTSNAERQDKNDTGYDHTMLIKKFITGGIVSSIAVTVMAPLDRIKLILQIQKISNIPKEEQYKGVWDYLRRIPKEQGFFAFWRGNTASIMRCFPQNALNFTFRDLFRDLLYDRINPTHFKSILLTNFLIGGLAGSAALCVIYPMDYARTRLAMDSGQCSLTREYSSMRDCIKDAYRTDGIRGIYRGLVFSIYGVFLYRASYFGIYDTGIDVIPPEFRNPITHFLLAELSCTLGGIISYPSDTVRRNMMMNSGSNPQGVIYKSGIDCFRHIYRTDGIRGLYHGNMVNIIRGTGGSIMLILYEYINVYILGDTSHTFVQKAVVKH